MAEHRIEQMKSTRYRIRNTMSYIEQRTHKLNRRHIPRCWSAGLMYIGGPDCVWLSRWRLLAQMVWPDVQVVALQMAMFVHEWGTMLGTCVFTNHYVNGGGLDRTTHHQQQCIAVVGILWIKRICKIHEQSVMPVTPPPPPTPTYSINQLTPGMFTVFPHV